MKFDDSKSVWHSFVTNEQMNVMAAGKRQHHPSRKDFYLFFEAIDRLRNKKLMWLDLGTVSMVDYNFLREYFNFDYVGADIARAIVANSKKCLTEDADNVYQWNIENPDIPEEVAAKKYDVISARHILNHCSYYEQPLLNLQKLLANDGFIYINLHLKCVDGNIDQLKTHNEWPMKGDVVGNFYSASKLRDFLEKHFNVLVWKMIEDNTIIIIEGRSRT